MERTMNRTFALALLAAAAACTFNFKNPAEDLRPGEVGGRAVVAAVPRPGVAVSVKGSTLGQGTRQTGRFLMLPLPVGNHTLLLRSGTGGLVTRDVEMRYGRDGQPEGIWIGDVAVPGERSATTIAGSVVGSSCGFRNGVVVDETSGQATAFETSDPVNYRIALFQINGLDQGNHRLTFAAYDDCGGPNPTLMVGGPVTVTISAADAGAVKTLTPIPLHVLAPSDQTGRIKVRLAGIGTSVMGYSIVLDPDPGNATLDSTGLIDASVAEGLYTLTVTCTGVCDPLVTLPPPTSAVVTEGQVTDVGTLYVTSQEANDAASLACSTDDDCAPGICAGGSCTAAYTPPDVSGSGYPLCVASDACSYAGQLCSPPSYVPMTRYCGDMGSGLYACLTEGSYCTTDGTTLVAGIPQG
jgi:hypothetical protein